MSNPFAALDDEPERDEDNPFAALDTVREGGGIMGVFKSAKARHDYRTRDRVAREEAQRARIDELGGDTEIGGGEETGFVGRNTSPLEVEEGAAEVSKRLRKAGLDGDPMEQGDFANAVRRKTADEAYRKRFTELPKWQQRLKTGLDFAANSVLMGQGHRVEGAAAELRGLGYERGEETHRTRLRVGEEENPVASYVGEGVGFVAPGLSMFKGASWMGKLANKSKTIRRVTTGTKRTAQRFLPAPTGPIKKSMRMAFGPGLKTAAEWGAEGAVYSMTVGDARRTARLGRDATPEEFWGAVREESLYGAGLGFAFVPVARTLRFTGTVGGSTARGIGRMTGLTEASVPYKNLADRFTWDSRKAEIAQSEMIRRGLDLEDQALVQKYLDDGDYEAAEKMLNKARFKALKMIEKRLTASDMSVEDFRAMILTRAADGDSVDEIAMELMGADNYQLGVALSMVNKDAQGTILGTLDDRADDITYRLMGTLNEAMGTDPNMSFDDLELALKQRTAEGGAEIYDLVEVSALDEDSFIKLLEVSPGDTKPPIATKYGLEMIDDAADLAGSRRGQQGVQAELKAFRAAIAKGDVPDALSAEATKYLDRAINNGVFEAPMGSSRRQGIKNVREDWQRVVDDSTGIGAARTKYKSLKDAERALKDGFQSFTQGQDLNKILSRVEKLYASGETDPEIMSALIKGWVRGAQNSLETATNAGTAMRRLTGSPRQREKLKKMIDQAENIMRQLENDPKKQRAMQAGQRKLIGEVDPDTGETVRLGRVEREARMEDTRQIVGRGSGTAERQASIEAQGAYNADEPVQDAIELVLGDRRDVARKLGRRVSNLILQRGIYNQKVARELAEILSRRGEDDLLALADELENLQRARRGQGSIDSRTRGDI
ncbi:MAG: hypothetical protein VXW22_07090, partial [Pseudomonadota bacterium]|nr:hypothetical protein [Pseudomonadota bacterium]